jgi:hypothetical protein
MHPTPDDCAAVKAAAIASQSQSLPRLPDRFGQDLRSSHLVLGTVAALQLRQLAHFFGTTSFYRSCGVLALLSFTPQVHRINASASAQIAQTDLNIPLCLRDRSWCSYFTRWVKRNGRCPRLEKSREYLLLEQHSAESGVPEATSYIPARL